MEKVEKGQRCSITLNNENTNTVYGYNEDKNEYIVPNFTLKEKDIIFPKLGNQNNADWTVGMELRNNLQPNNFKINGSFVSVGSGKK